MEWVRDCKVGEEWWGGGLGGCGRLYPADTAVPWGTGEIPVGDPGLAGPPAAGKCPAGGGRCCLDEAKTAGKR